MKTDDHLGNLLDEVLSDEPLEALRSDLRARCHEELSQRQRRGLPRWFGVGAAAAALILVTIGALLWKGGPGPASEPEQNLPGYLVATVPLGASQRVAARSDPIERIRSDAVSPIRTRPLAELNILIDTRPLPLLARVETHGRAEKITDKELLAHFDLPCGLVTRGDQGASFFFIHPEDEERFFVRVGR